MTCPVCGSPTAKRATGPRATYCSDRCKRRASYLRRRDELNAIGRAARAVQRAAITMRCPECAATFTPVRSMKQVYCSPKCATRATRYTVSRRCSVDGCDRPHNARGLCKMHWRRDARAEGRESNPAWDDRRRANWQKRHALTRGAQDAEPFDYREVYDRDGWICGICTEPVDSTLTWPDPMSVSLDHVVPVSRGGAHAPENAQCSHLARNVQKGARAA